MDLKRKKRKTMKYEMYNAHNIIYISSIIQVKNNKKF